MKKIAPKNKKSKSKKEQNISVYSSPKSVSLKSLPEKDQEIIKYSGDKLHADTKIFSSSEYEQSLKDSNIPLDSEVIGNKEKYKWKNAENFHSSVKFDVSIDDMTKYVCSLLSIHENNCTFDDVLDKFFKFRLNQLGTEELIVLQYKIDELIKEKVYRKDCKTELNQKIG